MPLLDYDLLDTVSRPGGSEVEWLGELAQRAARWMSARAGVYAYTYRIEAPDAVVLGGLAEYGTGKEYWPALSSWGAENVRTIARLYRTQVTTLRRSLEQARSLQLPMSDPAARFGVHGVRDLLVVMGQDGSGGGLILTAPAPADVDPSGEEHACLERLASELAVAHRTRTLRLRGEARLSRRESQIAMGLRQGMTDKAIAYGLGLSGSAVAEYTARLRHKLGCLPGEELMALEPASAAGLAFRLRLLEQLTPAEHAVACSLVTGLSHAQIARERGCSSRTVASHLSSVFRKARVSGRRELVARWFGASPSPRV
jgi:DNA-binding CsgD family transcriptional regulator